jgi:hypothetical protein
MFARRTTLLVSLLAVTGAFAAPAAWADAGTVLAPTGESLR